MRWPFVFSKIYHYLQPRQIKEAYLLFLKINKYEESKPPPAKNKMKKKKKKEKKKQQTNKKKKKKKKKAFFSLIS